MVRVKNFFFIFVTYAVLKKLLEYCDIAIVMGGVGGGGWDLRNVILYHNLKTTTVRRIVSTFCVVAIIYIYQILFGSTFKIQSNRPANGWLSSGLFRIIVVVDLYPVLQQLFLVSYIGGFEFHLTYTKKKYRRLSHQEVSICMWLGCNGV